MTAARPKCLVELGGKPLLDWQVSALRKGGVDRVVVVTGYLRELIAAMGVETLVNPVWESSNMVASLMAGIERVDAPMIVSYSDIVYDPSLVRRLIECRHELAISYDVDWRDLWERRFQDPLSDAESFRIGREGKIIEIGGKAKRVEDIQGQFMGLIRIGREAAGWIQGLLDSEPALRDRLDTTGLLMRLIQGGHQIHGVPTHGGWCEIDDQSDLAVAEALFASGQLGIE